MGSVEGLGSGPEGRIKRLRKLVSGLVRYERIETAHSHGDEARGYAEKLIQLAIKNGDRHKETMEMADYWLLEKDLIHKLFKVLVPRYQDYASSYTQMWNLPVKYPGFGHQSAVLELRGNPWPPVRPEQRDRKYLLSNILLQEARKDYSKNKSTQDAASLDYMNNTGSDTVQGSGVTETADVNSGRDSSVDKDVDKATKKMGDLNMKDGPVT